MIEEKTARHTDFHIGYREDLQHDEARIDSGACEEGLLVSPETKRKEKRLDQLSI
jgi:hypothetical protein